MKKSHLIQAIRSFSKKEIRDFRKWVQSPMHNQREDVVKLFDYLTSNDHLDNDEKLDKALIFKHLSPKEKYDDAKIRQTMYFFSECIDAFLIYQKFLEDEGRQQGFLSVAYRQKGLDKAFNKTINAFIEKKEKTALHSRQSYMADYEIQRELFNFKSKHERSQHTNFEAMQAALDNFYLVNKLQMACEALYHGKVFKVSYEIRFLESIFQFLDEYPSDQPLIKVYHTILLTLKFPEEESYFHLLKEQIKDYTPSFSWLDAHEIHLLAINYGASKLNQGKSEYRRDVFNLYKNGIESGFLLENDIISAYTFKNTVTLGIHLKELAWVEKFIEQYTEKLEPEQRKGLVDFNLAMLYYTKKDYKKAQRLLASFEVDDLLITLNAKFLLIKIYVEEGEYDLLDTHLSTMRVYLNRKEVLGYHKSLYKNVIHFTKKINRVTPYTKAEKEKLIEEIKAATPLADKEWFIRQVQEL
jgi:hypothetical protein